MTHTVTATIETKTVSKVQTQGHDNAARHAERLRQQHQGKATVEVKPNDK